MQRSLADRFGAERKLTWSYPYGLAEASLSDDALENFRVQFDRLRAVMPSGLQVDVPSLADMPSLDIKQAVASGRGAFNGKSPAWVDPAYSDPHVDGVRPRPPNRSGSPVQT